MPKCTTKLQHLSKWRLRLLLLSKGKLPAILIYDLLARSAVWNPISFSLRPFIFLLFHFKLYRCDLYMTTSRKPCIAFLLSPSLKKTMKSFFWSIPNIVRVMTTLLAAFFLFRQNLNFPVNFCVTSTFYLLNFII